MKRPFEDGEFVILKSAPARDYGEVMYTQRSRHDEGGYLVCVWWVKEQILKYIPSARLRKAPPLYALAMQSK